MNGTGTYGAGIGRIHRARVWFIPYMKASVSIWFRGFRAVLQLPQSLIARAMRLSIAAVLFAMQKIISRATNRWYLKTHVGRAKSDERVKDGERFEFCV